MTARLLEIDFAGRCIGPGKALLASTLHNHHLAQTVEGVLAADYLIRERMTRAMPCRGCGAEITMDGTDEGKWMPTNISGSPHWATCPKAAEFKRSKKR